jgi:hypothetical protein
MASVICATQDYSVHGIDVISQTVIEGGRLMGMFAAKRGRGASLFRCGGEAGKHIRQPQIRSHF